jgi:hypothetical protein
MPQNSEESSMPSSWFKNAIGCIAAVLGAMLAPIAAVAQTSGRYPQAVVLDANGKFVGPYVSATASLDADKQHSQDTVLLAIPNEQKLLSLSFNEQGFLPYDFHVAVYFFSTTDCSGQSYMSADIDHYYQSSKLPSTPPVISGVNIAGPSDDPRIAYYGSPVTFSHANSFRFAGTLKCIAQSGGTCYCGPTKIFPLSRLGFKPPFSVVLR